MSARAKKKAKTNARVNAKTMAKANARAKKTSAKSKAKVAKTKQVKKQVTTQEKRKKTLKPKKTSEKRENAPVKVIVKMGPPPMAIVSTRHIDPTTERRGKGFSIGELSSAGIILAMARREDLSVDSRRRSIVDQNVEALKGWVKDSKKSPASESTTEGAVTPAQ